MPTIKITCTFSQGGGGWSESYYLTATDAAGGLAAFRGIWEYRALCLAATTVWRNTRAEQIDGLNQTVTEDSTCRQLGKSSLPGDSNTNGVELLFRTSEGYQRLIIMRGMPDDWIKRLVANSNLFVTPDGKDAVDRWLAKVMTAVPVVVARQKPGDGNPKIPVVDLLPVQGHPHQTDVVIDGLVPDGTGVGSRVQVGGCRNIARATNGIYVVQGIPDGHTLRIGLISTRIDGFRAKDIKKAYFRPFTEVIKTVVSAVRRYAKTRKTGRVAGTPKGRTRR